MLLTALLRAQTNYYQFAQSTGVLETQPGSGVTTLVAAASADGASGVINIGFNLNYAGVIYTQLSASANGLVRLGGTAVTTESINSITSGTNVPKIMGFWDDMATGTNASGSGVRTWTVGVSPSRKRVVDFKLASNDLTTSAWDFQFQVWIHETSGTIEVVYGAGAGSGMSGSIGLGGAIASEYVSITPGSPGSASSASPNNAVAANPGSGVKYTYTAPAALTGSKTVGTGMNYPNLKEAVGVLNWVGPGSGGVTLNISGGHTETVPAGSTIPNPDMPAGLCITANGTAANPIVIQWNGVGAKPVFKAGAGIGNFDFVIGICGGDYITLDGLEIQEDNTNNTTNAKRAEIGIGLFKKQYNTTSGNDGCANISIKNCVITLTREPNGIGNYAYCQDPYFSTGIKASAFTSTHQGATNFFEGGNPNGGIKSQNDVHRNCLVTGNTIDNCSYGIVFADRWAASGANVYAGAGNVIGQLGAGNTVTNWGLKPGSNTSYGISESDMGRVVAGIAMGGQKDYTIEYNSVTNCGTNNLNTVSGPQSYCGILAGAGIDGNNWPHYAAGFFAKINYNTVSGIDLTTAAVDQFKCGYGISFSQFADHVTNTNLSTKYAPGNVEINNNTISGIITKRGDCHGVSCKYLYEHWKRTQDFDDRTGGFQSNASVSINNNTIKGLVQLTNASNDPYNLGVLSAIYWMNGQNNLYVENNVIGGAGADGLVRGTASTAYIARHLLGTRIIYLNAFFDRGTRTLVQVKDNTITNCDVLGSSSMTAANNWSVGFSAIFVQKGGITNNIQNNTITGCDVACGGRTVDTDVEVSFIRVYGKSRSGTSTINIFENDILNNTRTTYRYYGTNYGTNAFTAAILARNDATGQYKNIYNNVIDGIEGIAINATSAHLYYTRIEGIKVLSKVNSTAAVVDIYGNTIKNLSGDTYGYAHVLGNLDIYNYHRAFNTVGINVARYHRLKIHDNSICNLSTDFVGYTSDVNHANGVVGIMYGNDYGEYAPYSTLSDPKVLVYNNFIGQLSAPALRSRVAVTGAYQWGADHFKLFAHNTIALGGLTGTPTGRLTSSTSGAFGVTGFANYDYYRNNKVFKSAFANNVISINADCKGTGMGTAWRHIEMSGVKKAWRGIATYSSGNVYFVNNDANNYIYGQGITFNTIGGIRNCFGYGSSVTTNATYNLVNDNAVPNNFNQICGKYKSFMGGREKGSFIDLDMSNVMLALPFTNSGGCEAEMKIANGANSYVVNGKRLNAPYYNIGTDFYGAARGASQVTSGAHENNANIMGPTVLLIDFNFEPICDGVCTGTKSVDVEILPPSGKTIATASGKVPRLYYRRIQNNSTISAAQSDANTMVNDANNNATGTEGWRWVEATTVVGDLYTFDVNEAKLKNNITTTPTYTVEYFVIAETSDGTVCNWSSGDFSTNCPATVDLFSIAGAVTVPTDDDGDAAIDENSVDDRYTVYSGGSLTKEIQLVNNNTTYSANMVTALPVCTGDEIKLNGLFSVTSSSDMFNEGCVSYYMEVADNSAFSVNVETFIQSSPNFTYTMASSGTKYFRIWLECSGSKVTNTNTPYVFVTANNMPVNTSAVSTVNSCVGVSQNLTLASSTPTVSKYYWIANPHGKLYQNPPTATTNLTQVRAVNPADTSENGVWHTYVSLSSGSALANMGILASNYYDGSMYNTDGGDIDTTKGVAFHTNAMIRLDAISVLDDPNDGVGSAGFNISLYSKSGKLLYKTGAQSTTDGQLKQIALTNWFIPPGDYMIVMGASTLGVEPTGGLGVVSASFPIGIANTSTSGLDLLGGISDFNFDGADNGVNNYFFDWDVTIFCTSGDNPFTYIVNPASCCAAPTPTAALVSNGNNGLDLQSSKCSNISGDWIYYFDPLNPSKLLCAVNPNGNTWNPSNVNVFNFGLSGDSEHLVTDGTSTTEVMPYMVQVENTDETTINGGVKLRLFYPAAQKTIIDAYGSKTWFKFPTDKQGILDALEPTGLTGKTNLTPDATGTENSIPFVEFHNITSFSTFGYIGVNCVGTAIINETDNSCASNDSKVLSGAMATLTASGGVSYVWDDASTSAVRIVSPIASTTYSVIVTDGNGCTASESITISVVTNPTASISETDNSCAANDAQVLSGDAATLTASGGVTYSWDDASSAAIRVVNPAVNSTYTVTVTNADGCTHSATTAVSIVSLPVVSIVGSNSICEGELTSVSPNTGGNWVSSNNSIATVTNAGDVTGVSAGTATFTFTSSSSGCISAPTPPVTVNPIPAVSITGADEICIGTITTLSPSTGGVWSSSNNAVAAVTNAGIVTAVGAGTATFTFTNSSTGCVSDPTNPVTVNPLPVVSITGADEVCAGGTTSLAPVSGGSWTSSNNLIASVTNAGIVTGISAGSATFIYIETITGCESVPTSPVTVHALPVVSILGPNNICIDGTTGLSPSSGGSWTSSNPGVATVTNTGIVTGVSNGSVTFTFTDGVTGCTSLPTSIITVNPDPVVSVAGASSICINGTTTLTPSSGGIWVSSNPGVATVTNAGLVTGVSAGTVTFTFTDITTGCESSPTAPVTVNSTPAVSITGASSICVGSTTTLSPTTGGTWISSDPGVATVTNAGVVTGVSSGTATFTFTDGATGCQSLPTAAVTVNPLPTVSINGSSSICIGATTGLSPNSGGTWMSSNPGVATVTNAGIVTGVSAGTATFTFTNTATGCISAPTAPVTVNPTPVVSITGAASICENETTTLSPSSGGTWVSTTPSVATVTNAGIVTGVSAGTSTFIYTNSTTGCVSDPTPAVTVEPIPIVSIIGSSSLCIGETTNLSPSSGGTWSSSNPGVATVTNGGVVTAVTAGTATFIFTNTSTGCISAPTSAVTVNATPAVNITGSGTICVNSTTTLSPTSGGTWTSSNPGVATVTNGGVVTGVSAGTATFTFTSSGSGCQSAPTSPVTVNPLPTVNITGSSTICVNANTTLSPASGGSWTSSNPAVATVTNSGIVTGISAGTVTFTFTSSSTGCQSAPTLPVTVNALPTVNITGANSICVNQTTTLSPTSGGTWSSSNPAIATVSNAGVVTGVSAGSATFVFTNGTTGCISAPTAPVTINAIPVVSITGSSSICIGSTTALSPTSGGTWTSSNPSVATVTNAGLVTAVSAGTATFTFTNTGTGCISMPTSPVTVNPDPTVSITGSTSVCVGQTTTLSPTSGGTWTSSSPAIATVTNGGLVTGISAGTVTFTFTDGLTGCISDPTGAVTVNAAPIVSISGSNSICVGNTTTLTPTTGGTWSSSNPAVATVTNGGIVTGVSAGTATFTFTSTSTGCQSAPTAPVTINALPSVSITGNNSICIGATTTLSPTIGGTWSSSNPAVATVSNSGVVTGVGEGTVTFTFTNSSTGCISNPTGTITVAACNSLVAARAFLGGPYDPNTDLMFDHLRAANLIPTNQPYNGPQYTDFNYNGTETIGAGVLNVTGDDAIVDWVLLELRDAANPSLVVAQKAALIQRDGDVVESSDGVSDVEFVGTPADDYYVVIRHRTHLGVMSSTPITLNGTSGALVNFTSAGTGNYQLAGPTGTIHAQRTLTNGKRALWEGNMSNLSGSGDQIQYQGSNSDSDEPYYRVLLDPGNIMIVPNYIVNGYDRADGNMDGMVIYQGSDSDSDIPFFNVLAFPDNILFLPNYIIYEQIP
ncbi:MAG TPA: Ig-like domain-containing protein [Saprospiraceae bacterium]|nr:Ig-like domain-containing protein [Saprospiraceae bacterium]